MTKQMIRKSLTHFIKTLSTHKIKKWVQDDRGLPVVALLIRSTEQIINKILLQMESKDNEKN